MFSFVAHPMVGSIIAFAAVLLSGFIIHVGHGSYHIISVAYAKNLGYDWAVDWVIACYFLGVALGPKVTHYLLRRVNYIRSFIAESAIVAACILLFAMIEHPVVWIILRIIHGITFGGVITILEGWINSSVTLEYRSRLYGIFFAGCYLTLALGQYTLSIHPEDIGQIFPIAAFFIILAVIPVALTRQTEPIGGSEIVAMPFLDVYRLTPIVVIGMFLIGILLSSSGLIIIYGYNSDFSTEIIATLGFLFYLSGLILPVPMGAISDRTKNRRSLVIAVFAVSTGMSITLVLADILSASALIIAGLVFLYGIIVNILYPTVVTYGADFVDRSQFSAYYMRLQQAYSVGGLVGPILIGWVMRQLGDTWLFLGFFAVCAAMMGIFFSEFFMAKITPLRQWAFRNVTAITPIQRPELSPATELDIGPALPDDAAIAVGVTTAETDPAAEGGIIEQLPRQSVVESSPAAVQPEPPEAHMRYDR